MIKGDDEATVVYTSSDHDGSMKHRRGEAGGRGSKDYRHACMVKVIRP